MRIDVHVHVGEVPNHIPVWWGQELYRPWKYTYDADGKRRERPVTREPVRPETLLRDMEEAGLDRACIMAYDFRRASPGPEKPNPHVPNDYVAGLAREHPDKFIAIAGIDPMRGIAEALDELDRCINELGMKALKLMPTYCHFDPGDPYVYPLYERAIEYGIYVQFHMGWTPSVNAPMKFQPPHLLDPVGIRFPEMKVIVAHTGWPWWEEGVCLVAKHPNFHAEMAYWCTLPPETLLRALLMCRDLVGLDRVLYGSEYRLCIPKNFMATYERINETANRLGLPEIDREDIENILGNNAARLLGLMETAPDQPSG